MVIDGRRTSYSASRSSEWTGATLQSVGILVRHSTKKHVNANASGIRKVPFGFHVFGILMCSMAITLHPDPPSDKPVERRAFFEQHVKYSSTATGHVASAKQCQGRT
jgi:hypothetical protein